jgi:RNA polymerase sigma-70 factor (ECF subfamily)
VTEKEQQHIFENWIDEYKAILFKVARAYAFTPMDRDDLFQEISIQVWFSVPAFKGESAVSTWLYRIAFNTALKWIKKERKHLPAEAVDNLQHILHERNVETDERLNWLYAEIHKLDEIDRSLFLLLLDNFSYREMAAITGISESNVGVKINRIKKQLIKKSKQFDHGF